MWSLFSKCWNFYVNFRNAVKLSENVSGFEDNWVGTCCGNFSLLWQENMWSAANLLKDDRNISDLTERHGTKFTSFDININFSSENCCVDFSSVWDPLTC